MKDALVASRDARDNALESSEASRAHRSHGPRKYPLPIPDPPHLLAHHATPPLSHHAEQFNDAFLLQPQSTTRNTTHISHTTITPHPAATMSGHDDSDFGQDALLSGTTFDPNAQIDWATEDFLYVNNDNFDLDGPMHGNMEIAENNNSILPNAPVQEGPAFDGTTLNGTGSVNDNFSQLQFLDQPQFASPPAQNFGAEPISNTPLVNLNQADDQPIHTPAPTQAFQAQPDFIPNPSNYGINSHNALGLNNNPAWSLNGVNQQYSQLYPATTIPGQYPVPSQRQWSFGPFLERTLSQQGDQVMAGAGAFDPHNNFQVHAAGNQSFGPQPQGSLSNTSNGLPHPTAPQALRNLATQPASDVGATPEMSQDTNDDAKPVPPPAEPVKKETKTKQRSRKRQTTSTAKQPAVKVPIHSSELLVSNLVDAKTTAITRIPLEVVDDDRNDVAAHPEIWVPKIAKALEVEFRTQAESHDRLTKLGRDEFTRWQEEHENKTWSVLSKQKDVPKFAQSCAYVLYDKALESHVLGLEDPGKAVANGGSDVKSKCSERINAAIIAIEEYSIVKYDFLCLDRLGALLASPSGFVKRKIENVWVNFKKKEKRPVFVGEASRVAPKTKSQGKRKRKETSPVSDDEDEEDEMEGEDDEEFEQPTKRTKRR